MHICFLTLLLLAGVENVVGGSGALTAGQLGPNVISTGNVGVTSPFYDEYIKAFGKHYDDTREYKLKQNIFLTNLKKIQYINKHENMTWKAGVNKFTDMSQQEIDIFLNPLLNTNYFTLQSKILGTTFNLTSQNTKTVEKRKTSYCEIVDWVKRGMVSNVKNQKSCGSCWMFAANDALESSYAIKNNINLKGVSKYFSVQQAGECAFANLKSSDPSFKNSICDGGWSTLVFDTITQKKDYFIMGEDAFPYKAVNLGYCPVATYGTWRTLKPTWKYGAGYSSGIVAWNYGKENIDILKRLVRLRPQPIYLYVDSNFMYYSSGVFTSKSSPNKGVNHAVLVVGFKDCGPNNRYWLIKNSWSKDWGEQGYMRLAMTYDTYGTSNMYGTIMNTPVFNMM